MLSKFKKMGFFLSLFIFLFSTLLAIVVLWVNSFNFKFTVYIFLGMSLITLFVLIYFSILLIVEMLAFKFGKIYDAEIIQVLEYFKSYDTATFNKFLVKFEIDSKTFIKKTFNSFTAFEMQTILQKKKVIILKFKNIIVVKKQFNIKKEDIVSVSKNDTETNFSVSQ